MNKSFSAATALNNLVKNQLGRRLRPFIDTRAVRALIVGYQRWLQPAVRRVYPLFGVTVMIGLTYKCQCRCVHCGTVPYRDPERSELSEAEVVELMSQAGALGAGGVSFFGGEPLLAKGLLEMVRAAKSLGLLATLDTNGLLLDRDLARSLAGAGLDRIGVSLDSADEAEHDRLRQTPGVYRAALNAIGFCRDAGIDVFLSTYATGESLRDGGLDRIIAIARSLGVRTRVLSPLRAGKWLKRDDVGLSPGEVALLRSRLSGEVYWESVFLTSPERPFMCSCASRTHFYVSPYGDVQPCCYMPLSFGNVREEPMKRIVKRMWGSAMFASLDSSVDCPMNSPRFREVFGPVLSRPGPGPHPAELASSPNDPREWDEWAGEYARDVDWLEEIHNRDLAALLPSEGKKVLDAGCGTGRRSRALFGRAARLTAVDSSKGMVKAAKEALALLPQAEVLELDIEQGGLPRGEFDAVLAVSVLHHIRNAEAAVRNLVDSMAPGGTLVIIDAVAGQPGPAALRYYLELLFRHSPLRLFRAFLDAFFSDTRVARHKRREVPLTFEEFRRRYAPLLPGAAAEVRHGIFAYLVWRKPGGASPGAALKN